MPKIITADPAWREVEHAIPRPISTDYWGSDVDLAPMPTCRTPLPAVVCACGLYLIDEVPRAR